MPNVADRECAERTFAVIYVAAAGAILYPPDVSQVLTDLISFYL
jgi:hypothetical protein